MYEKIKTKDDYDLLLKSGMFGEFHPELSGNWEEDKNTISDNCSKISIMSNLQEKTNKEYPMYDVATSVSKTDEYNGNEIQFIKRSAFQNGYELCQKEYEEKLRWIPVEEELPGKDKKKLKVIFLFLYW